MPSSGINEPKKFPILIWLIGFASMIGFFGWINERLASSKQVKTDTELIKVFPEPSPEPTIYKPEQSPEITNENDPYDVMVSIGKEATDNSNVSVFENKRQCF